MNVTINPSKLSGTVWAPPSKSYAHRMLICASFATGTSILSGIAESEDVKATLDCLHALGISFNKEGDELTLCGAEKAGTIADAGILPTFPCRESGSTLRFFIPIALALCGGGIFTGTERLLERGIGIYEELFRDTDIRIEKEKEKVTVRGTLKAGQYKIRGDVSSQFITGMLFALSLLKGDSIIEVLPPVESRGYIDMTIDVMKMYGVIAEEIVANIFTIHGGQHYNAIHAQVEGDWSNGAFLHAFNVIGNMLRIEGLREDSLQRDKACVKLFAQLATKADAGSSASETESTGDPIDLSDVPDLGPVLFAVAATLHGGKFTGIRRLRIKESDRAAVMAEELAKFGIKCNVSENDMEIFPSELKKPEVPLDGCNDHRIVMALSIPATITGAEIIGAEAVKKSWPEYFDELIKAGTDIRTA